MGKFMVENINSTYATRMKLYRVYIELAQNVFLYSAERANHQNNYETGVGSLIVKESDSVYTCTTLNKILGIHADILSYNCSNINVCSEDELKKKKTVLRKSSKFHELGAHIGLIMIKLYSGNPLQFQIIDDNNLNTKFFEISATINKIY